MRAVVRRGIVVATGTRAVIPTIPGLGRVPYWTNREAVEAKELPSSLIVLGGARSVSSLPRCSRASGPR